MARKKIQSATDQRPFIMVYQDFLESNLLDNYYQKLVYIYLKKFADSNNQCFPSIKKLSSLTKIGTTKVKQTLAELEEKGVISKVNRSRSDGGKTSNLYTLYDFAEIWKVGSSENVAAVAEEISEAKMIATLKAKGYTVIKEKESDTSADQSNDASDTNNNHYYGINTTLNHTKSQELERYSIEEIKELYDYSVMVNDHPELQDHIDSVMEILHTTLNSTKKSIRISGESRPTLAVIGKLMKLGYSEILYCIRKYTGQTVRIKNPTAYMLTLLYGAKEQMNLDLSNQVQHDLANWNDDKK